MKILIAGLVLALSGCVTVNPQRTMGIPPPLPGEDEPMPTSLENCAVVEVDPVAGTKRCVVWNGANQ